MSIPLDNIRTAPCLIETGKSCFDQNGPGGPGGPGDPGDPGDPDPRCLDPVFAAANPLICGTTTRLVIKPGIATICESKSVQFKAFLASDTEEVALTTGVKFSSSNENILVIGILSGNATGIGAGTVTVSVEWQGLIAFAQVQISAGENCCDTMNVGMLLLIDNSKSMSDPMQTFGTKLNFAKEAAKAYAGDLITTKDKMAVMSFGNGEVLLQDFTNNITSLQSSISNIPSSVTTTDIEDALRDAITKINATTGLSMRVIVIISDGEHKGSNNPLLVSQPFLDSGGVIVAMGVRAHSSGYELMSRMASGGMFINSIATNSPIAIELLRGTKGYYCAGNCQEPGNEYVAKGELNYDRFSKWDVDSSVGPVDLIGNGFYDFLPGNGLYVDLVGSGPPWLGKMVTKRTFDLISGNEYRLTFKLAGNHRTQNTGFKVSIKMGGFISDLITIDDPMQGFVEHPYSIIPAGPVSAKIEIGQAERPGQSLSYGNLLGEVKLVNVTTGEVLFFDNFDTENLTFISPRCGYGSSYGPSEDGYGYGYSYGYGYGYGYSAAYGYGYGLEYGEYSFGYDYMYVFGQGGFNYGTGYNCYGFGCLDEPITGQEEELSPPTDTEETVTMFTSTKSYTADCPAGSSGPPVTKSATAGSVISQADADEKALTKAQSLAESALVCPYALAVGWIINGHFQVAGGAFQKRGIAVLGNDANDFWNHQHVGSSGIPGVSVKNSDGDLLSVTMRTYGEGTDYNIEQATNLDNPDILMREGVHGTAYVTELAGLPTGTYDLLVYGHGGKRLVDGMILDFHDDNMSVHALINGVDQGEKHTTVDSSSGYDTDDWQDGIQYVRYSGLAVTSGQVLAISVWPNALGRRLINGFQLLRKT